MLTLLVVAVMYLLCKCFNASLSYLFLQITTIVFWANVARLQFCCFFLTTLKNYCFSIVLMMPHVNILVTPLSYAFTNSGWCWTMFLDEVKLLVLILRYVGLLQINFPNLLFFLIRRSPIRNIQNFYLRKKALNNCMGDYLGSHKVIKGNTRKRGVIIKLFRENRIC